MRVLALDVGSSSTRACAYDERGREVGSPARRTYEARHDRDAPDRPLTPVLLWQDRRAAAQAQEFAARLDPEAVHARTGCFLHPSFWPAKLAWLGSRATEASRIVSFADYLFLRLTGE